MQKKVLSLYGIFFRLHSTKGAEEDLLPQHNSATQTKHYYADDEEGKRGKEKRERKTESERRERMDVLNGGGGKRTITFFSPPSLG